MSLKSLINRPNVDVIACDERARYYHAKTIGTKIFIVASAEEWARGKYDISVEAMDEGWQLCFLDSDMPCVFSPAEDVIFAWNAHEGVFRAYGSFLFIDMYDAPTGPIAVYVP